MVTLIAVEQRQNAQGENFFALLLEGDLTFVTSKQSGRLYATAFRISVPSTFSEEGAKRFIGKQLPGIINKVECEPYEYTTKQGEVIVLNHTYSYSPNPANLAESIIGGNPEM